MQKIQPPGQHLVQPLLKHFQDLLEYYVEYCGTQSSSGSVVRVSSNYSNIENILRNGLRNGHPDLVNSIYCTCYLNQFSQFMGQGASPLIGQIYDILPQPRNHQLEIHFIIELLDSRRAYPNFDRDTLVSKALEHFKQLDDPDLKCMVSD
jgi:hypothetical protein